jgi:hypothetical protein
MAKYRYVIYNEETDRPVFPRVSYENEEQAEKHCEKGQYVVTMQVIDSAGPFGDVLRPVGA